METRARNAGAGELVEAERSFDRWRRNRRRRGRIPEPLWQMATEAAASHGVCATARRLRLNPTKLKERIERLKGDRASEGNTRFVELPWPGAGAMPECILEAEDRAGRKLRIHLKGSATAQVVSLAPLLWRGEG